MTQDEELLNSLCPNEREKFDIWFAELNDMLTSNNEQQVTTWFDDFTEGYSPMEAILRNRTNQL